MLKVLFHISDLDRWKLTINNIRNLLKTNQEMKIAVCVNSEASKNYVDLSPKHYETLEELSKEYVTFYACKNSLHALNIKEEELPEFVTIVPAVVLDIIEKQKDGYAYIKA